MASDPQGRHITMGATFPDHEDGQAADLGVPFQRVQALAGEDVPDLGGLVSRRSRQVCASVRELD